MAAKAITVMDDVSAKTASCTETDLNLHADTAEDYSSSGTDVGDGGFMIIDAQAAP